MAILIYKKKKFDFCEPYYIGTSRFWKKQAKTPSDSQEIYIDRPFIETVSVVYLRLSKAILWVRSNYL